MIQLTGKSKPHLRSLKVLFKLLKILELVEATAEKHAR